MGLARVRVREERLKGKAEEVSVKVSPAHSKGQLRIIRMSLLNRQVVTGASTNDGGGSKANFAYFLIYP